MTNTEQLIEAAAYASENDLNWYEIFDSKTEALRVINSAQKEIADEEQIICLLLAQEAEDMFESCTIECSYREVLKIMKKELNNSEASINA